MRYLQLAKHVLLFGGGQPTSPGIRENAALDTPYTSRIFYPAADVGDAVTVADGTYQVLSAGGFVSTADTFADGDYYELRGTSSASYETDVLPTLTIGGVDYVFTIATLAELPSIADRYTNTDHYTNTGHYL